MNKILSKQTAIVTRAADDLGNATAVALANAGSQLVMNGIPAPHS